MKRFEFILALSFLALSTAAVSQPSAAALQMPYSGAPCTGIGGINASASQVEIFNRFDRALRSALKRQDAAALSFLIRFPLRVNTSKGALLIPDAESLSGHYAEIFPPEISRQVLSTTSDDYWCRYDEGLSYKDSVLWASTDGSKFAVDTVNTSDLHNQSQKDRLVYTCETKTHRISIEQLNSGKYRYRSWNKPKELTETPDVDLSNGEIRFDGTGVCSTAAYLFTKGNVAYELHRGLGCGDGSEPKDATGSLNVSIGGKQVTDAFCF